MSLTRKSAAPVSIIRNRVTGTAIIEVPPAVHFMFPVPDAPAPYMKVTTVTVFPPTSPLAITSSGQTFPVFTFSGTLTPATPPGPAEFYDNPVQFTDVSVIPRTARVNAVRDALTQILQEMSAAAAPTAAEGGTVITVDFSARTRARARARA